MSTAVRVRQTPKDTGCTELLGQLRRDWTARLHALTSVVDDVTDFNDFVLMTGMLLFLESSTNSLIVHDFRVDVGVSKI